MYGDFSKASFLNAQFAASKCPSEEDLKKDDALASGEAQSRFTHVLFEQGRPLTDADLNENSSLLLREVRELARSLIGWHGTSNSGFQIVTEPNKPEKIILRAGTYFIDGLRCIQPVDRCIDLSAPIQATKEKTEESSEVVLYLEAWDVTDPPRDPLSSREAALKGIRTSVRSNVEWRLLWGSKGMLLPTNGNDASNLTVQDLVQDRARFQTAVAPQAIELAARWSSAAKGSGPCELAGDSSQAAQENALYRVEIHRGRMQIKGSPPKDVEPSFKWSKLNGSESVVVSEPAAGSNIFQYEPDKSPGGPDLRTERLAEWVPQGRCSRDSLDTLLMITNIDPEQSQITVGQPIGQDWNSSSALATSCSADAAGYLRFWDHGKTVLWKPDPMDPGTQRPEYVPLDDYGAVTISVGDSTTDNNATGGTKAVKAAQSKSTADKQVWWFDIENGLQIAFEMLDASRVRAGDYWLIETRSDGSLSVNHRRVDSQETEQPVFVKPWPERHCAPLTLVPASFDPAAGLNLRPTGLFQEFRHDTPDGSSIWKRVLGMPEAVVEPPPRGFENCKACGAAVAPPAGDAAAPPTGAAAAPESPGDVNHGDMDTAAMVPAGQFRTAGFVQDSSDKSEHLASLLSDAGLQAIRRYVASPKDILRRVPARYLNHQVRSAALRKWLATALVSEVANQSIDSLLQKVERTFSVADSERPELRADAEDLLRIATNFRRALDDAPRFPRVLV